MKPSILFILHLPPPVHGAAMVGQYIKDSKLINQSFDCRFINLAIAKDLEDIGKTGIRKFVSFFHLLHRIYSEVRTMHPDLVYVTPNAKGGAFYKEFVIVQMLKWLGCKVVAHYHNKGVSIYQDRRLDDFLYERFFKDLKVILLADVLYKDIKKYVDLNDVSICANGIPDSFIENIKKTPKENWIPQILFLSNLLIEKGVIVLLDACCLLKNKNIPFKLVIVGGETNELDAKQLSLEINSRGLTQCVEYQGRKYGSEKERILRKSDMFVFPTFYHNECFPLVLLEAMANSLPCISTNEGGIPGIISQGVNGYMVEKKNAVQLAEKIETLICDKMLLQAMSRNARKSYVERFTLQGFEIRLNDILNSLTQS